MARRIGFGAGAALQAASFPRRRESSELRVNVRIKCQDSRPDPKIRANHSTGGYHCHNAKTPDPNRVTYCHEVNGSSRCGYALRTCQDLVREYGGYCRRD